MVISSVEQKHDRVKGYPALATTPSLEIRIPSPTMKLQPYSVSSYNAIPFLGESHDTYQTRQLSGLINTTIRDVYLKHNVQSRLGLSLMHRHFDLEQGELLVNVGNVATPWVKDDVKSDLLRSVEPTQWHFDHDGVVPSEFTYMPNKSSDSLDASKDSSFLAELHDVLMVHGLTKFFGIGLLTAEDFNGSPPIEATYGRANIAFPFEIEKGDGPVPEVSWYFETDPFVKRGCSRQCYAKPPGHLTSHSTTKP